MTDPAIIGMFFDEMDRRIRSMQARGIQPCDPSADVYTPAGPKAVEYAREILADRDRLDARIQELEMQSRGNWIDAEQEARRAVAAEAELSAARESLRMLTIESAHTMILLQARLSEARAAIEVAYREGFSDGAYCFEESAKPEKYVEESWLQSAARAASSAGGPQS